MLSSVHYLIRSKQDGQYLVARANERDVEKKTRSLLILRFTLRISSKTEVLQGNLEATRFHRR